MIHLDTHVVIWLYNDALQRLPARARRRLQAGPPSVSPMVRLELGFLHERGRIIPAPVTVLAELGRVLGLIESCAPWADVITSAEPLTWTRDPFDRLIVANALADGADLMTADEQIRAHLPAAVWD